MVTAAEFAGVMAYLSAGCGKPVTEQQAEVYFSLLGDLPAAALRAAAMRALLESQYPVLPPVGTVRRLAVEAMQSAAGLPCAAEAWGMVRRAIAAYGYAREREALAALPDVVRRTVEGLGWQDLCGSEAGVEIVRAQFHRAYEQVAGRAERERLLPAPLKEALRQVGQDWRPVEADRRNAWPVLKDAGREDILAGVLAGVGAPPKGGAAT